MILIGIDPSLTGTGICGIFVEPHRVRWASRVAGSSPAGQSVRARVARFAKLACLVAMNVRGALKTWEQSDPPSVIAIEAYSLGSRGHQHDLAEYGGILRAHLCVQFPAAEIIEVVPTLLKKFATGSGNADQGKPDKPEMRRHVWQRWKASFGTTDETDAFVLARMAGCFKGVLACETVFQKQAIQVVRKGAMR